MIERVTMSGFRKFAKRRVDFVPGLNVLVGRSGSGKSTIIRAIRWVMLNRPAGDGVIGWGQDQAKAALRVDGRKVTRVKGGGVNEYWLDGAVFKSFGQDVPEDVASLLNVSAAFNFSGQHAAPFLFNLTPGEAARELNAVVCLDQIDEVLGHLASGVRRASSEVADAEDRVRRAEDRVRETAWVDALGLLLAAAESAAAEVSKLEEICAALEGAISRCRAAEAKMRSLESVTLSREEESEVDDLLAAIDDLERRAGATVVALRKVEQADKARRRCVANAKAAEKRLADFGDRCPLCGGQDLSRRAGRISV